MVNDVNQLVFSMQKGFLCRSCDTKLEGEYCHNCGEKKFDKTELSLTHYIKSVFQEVTELDSTFFRTFVALLSKPGELTKAYLDGRKTLYIKPSKIYLILVPISFIILSNIEPINFYDLKTLIKTDSTGILGQNLAKLAQQLKLDFPVFIEKFNEYIKNFSTFFSYIEVVFFALFLKLFYLRSNKYYVEHLIFSLHFYSFLFLLFIITSPLGFISAKVFSIIPSILYIAYLAIAIKQVYLETKIKALLKSVGLFLVVALLSGIFFLAAFLLALFMIKFQA